MTGAPAPGPHGGDAHRLAAALGRPVDDVVDLSASLNPVAPDSAAVLGRHLGALGRYPDDGPATAALAEQLGVDPQRLVLTNGGAEAIALVAAEYPVGAVERCEFSLYARHLAEVVPDGPRWRSDPHNPTGTLADPDDVAAVRDEAFYLLATGRWGRFDPDAIALGSLTKAWALPGLRIGYVLAPDDAVADAVRRRRPRWSVNGLVCAALGDLLALADPVGWHRAIAELRGQLIGVLAEHGWRVASGSANYVWLPEAVGLRDALAPHGILVRDGASFGHPGAVRIAVPGPDDLDRLDRALSSIDPDAVRRR